MNQRAIVVLCLVLALTAAGSGVSQAGAAESITGDRQVRMAEEAGRDVPSPTQSGGEGRIRGQVISLRGEGLGGVSVVVEGVAAEVSDAAGTFLFASLPAGRYRLTFTLGERTATEAGVEVRAGSTTELIEEVDWPLSFGETITVISASRRRERIVDAPAAVTVVPASEIEREAAHGQVPKLLEFTPGVELTQSGTFDFNLNVRGFNGSLNRRILVLIDGRDPSMPFLGAQTWANLSLPLFELASLELVRGPSSALYGTDAVNGVLSLITKSSRERQGGRVQLSGGELDTRRIDLSHAGTLDAGWTYRISGGYQDGSDFSRSRNLGVEYEGLPPETVPLGSAKVEVVHGGLRFDKVFGNGRSEAFLTLEGGTGNSQGVTFVTDVGRAQVLDSKRPWARMSFTTGHWNLLAAHSVREARVLVLGSGGESFFDSGRDQIEIQGHTDFAKKQARLVGGASYTRSAVDSAAPEGRQTALLEKTTEERIGVFAQLDYSLSDRFKAVVAARWDDSNRYDAELSPKAALVFRPNPRHSLRLTYNEAFQSPNTAHFFVQVGIAPPLDLSAIEQALAPQLGGVGLGLEAVPFLALGNEHLSVERIQAFELGYSGTLGQKHFLSVDVYRSEIEDFVSALLPQVGTSLGRLNPGFGPYRPPAELSPEAAATVQATLEGALPPSLFALLSNNVDGSPVFAVLSYTNVGRVETTGFELALSSALSPRWRFDFSYSHFDFDVRKEAAENPILPNAPEDKLSLGLSYTGERLDLRVGYRWSDELAWRGGPFAGTVPSYGVADVVANYSLDEHWKVGVNIANPFDNEHYEIFGGDILRRRALASISVSW